MIEFIEVSHPVMFPQACVGCMSGKGPMVDTHRTLPGYGHVYVCQACAKTIARVLGFADGRKLDELEGAAKAVHERDNEIAGLRQKLGGLALARDELSTRLANTEDELADARQRIGQLEDRIREEASAALSLVGGEVA